MSTSGSSVCGGLGKDPQKNKNELGAEKKSRKTTVETELAQVPAGSGSQKSSISGKGRSSKGSGKQAIPAVSGGLLQSLVGNTNTRHFMSNVFGGSSSSKKKSRNKGKWDKESVKGATGGVDSQSEASWVTTGGDVDTYSNSSSLGGGAVGGSIGGSFHSGDGNMKECSLCLGEYGPDQWFKLRNNYCRHQFCVNCLHQYVRIEVQEGRVNLKCPECPCSMHPNDIESLSVSGEDRSVFDLYHSLMVRRVLAADQDTRWCPAPDCTFAVIATGCASCPKIKCEREGCNYSFCYHCKAEWHEDLPCDKARARRQQTRSNSITLSQGSGFGQGSELKECPRCSVFIVKMEDGSCNHMTCSVCGAEFCWLCMNEITDLHYLSPSGCTFWGKEQWGRKKKILWQLGTLIGAPVGIALLAGISIPAMIIGIPVYVGKKLHGAWNKNPSRHKKNLVVISGVTASILIAPVIAALAVSIGVPVLLAYVYGVVPISLCRSVGCLSDKQSRMFCCSANMNIGNILDEDNEPYTKARDLETGMGVPSRVINPSIGEVSSGPSLSLDSGSNLDRDVLTECDRESASNTAMAGHSLTGSVASSYHQRLEVGADVHPRKKFSFSSERLSETVSLNEKSGSVSLAEDGTASTRALAGSFINCRMENVSVSSYRAGIQTPGSAGSATTGLGTPGEVDSGVYYPGVVSHSDEISLRSLPGQSLSPIISISGEELTAAVRKSRRRHGFLDKQLSETGTEEEDRVRFDDKVSFIEANSPEGCELARTIHESQSVLVEETPEELAMVVSPQPKRVTTETVSPASSLSDSCVNTPLLHSKPARNESGISIPLNITQTTDMSSNVTNISIEHESLSVGRQESKETGSMVSNTFSEGNVGKSVTIKIGDPKTDQVEEVPGSRSDI